MAEYIDRAELCKVIDAYFLAVTYDIPDSSIVKQVYKMAHTQIKEIARNMPTADELAK